MGGDSCVSNVEALAVDGLLNPFLMSFSLIPDPASSQQAQCEAGARQARGKAPVTAGKKRPSRSHVVLSGLSITTCCWALATWLRWQWSDLRFASVRD